MANLCVSYTSWLTGAPSAPVEVLDYEPSHEELCQRRGSFFFEHRARIGLAAAQAAAIRVGGHHPPPTAASSSFVPSSFAPEAFHFDDDEDLLYY